MIELLEPLARTPGVRWVGLVTQDGVPIAVPGSAREGAPEGEPIGAEAVAALATSWLDEATRSLATLSWDAPRRVVLRAARGTLLFLGLRGAVLLVVLDSGVGPEELRLPMDGVVARIQRVLRGMGQESRERRPSDGLQKETPPALPSSGAVHDAVRTASPMTTHDSPEQAEN